MCGVYCCTLTRNARVQTVPSIVVAANSAKWIEAVTGSAVNDGIIGLCGVVAACTNIYKVWKSLK